MLVDFTYDILNLQAQIFSDGLLNINQNRYPRAASKLLKVSMYNRILLE